MLAMFYEDVLSAPASLGISSLNDEGVEGLSRLRTRRDLRPCLGGRNMV